MFKTRERKSKIGQSLCMLALCAASVAQGQGLLGKFVVVGDSLSAGFQNFSLFDDAGASLYLGSPQPIPYTGGQNWGYAKQIANQAGADLNIPLIAWPGIPPALGSNRTDLGSREDTKIQTSDLSVPGYLLGDALGRIVDTSTFELSSVNVIDVMAFEVLAYPSINNFSLFTTCGVVPLSTTKFLLSEAACALKQQPDTLIVWIGNNDALQALTTVTQPTDPEVFATEYDVLLATLKASGAKLVIANIPDVTHLPFLMQCATGNYKGLYLVPNIANPPMDPTSACSVGTSTGQFLEIPATLVTQAHNDVAAYNATIAAEAKKFGATLVDMYSLLENVYKKHGYTLGKITLGNGAGGGLFSLDLIHPTDTAYAVLANTFISAMNKAIQPKNAQIRPICVNDVAAQDLLVPPALHAGLPGKGCLQ